MMQFRNEEKLDDKNNNEKDVCEIWTGHPTDQQSRVTTTMLLRHL